MTIKRVLTWISIGAALAACESGDINLAPTNIDTRRTPAAGAVRRIRAPSTPSAARRSRARSTARTAPTARRSPPPTNPITVDLQIPFISGVHIFQDSLFIGDGRRHRRRAGRRHGAEARHRRRQHARLHGLGGLPPHQSRLADHRAGLRQRADHDHRFHRCREPHRRCLRRAALGRHRDQRQRHHEQLHGRAAHDATRATSCRRACRRTTAATTTPKARAPCATSSSSTPASKSRRATS